MQFEKRGFSVQVGVVQLIPPAPSTGELSPQCTDMIALIGIAVLVYLLNLGSHNIFSTASMCQ